ncbi:hypothetical protein [Actinocrispum sp. NPDC049592]|uniref:hypothetical protein n=1 Tax=Actinocrispum sp. NPDC049592 TaxID=3154835 RepID=UPI0034169511
MRRTVTYLADGANHEEVQSALEELLDAFDLEVETRGPEIRGSFFQWLKLRLKRVFTAEELTERLQRVERGFELHLLHKQQAEIDSLQSDAVAKLVTALRDERSALIQIGSVLLIKVDGALTVRNLTQLEMHHLERNASLLEQPDKILGSLESAVRQARGTEQAQAERLTEPTRTEHALPPAGPRA